MNKLFICGNLTKAPEMRSTASGVTMASFDVAVNGTRKNEEKPIYFHVTAWRELGESCARYLGKGSRVNVLGSVSAHPYVDRNGNAQSQLDVNADVVEFLSKPSEEQKPQSGSDDMFGFPDISNDDIPFD